MSVSKKAFVPPLYDVKIRGGKKIIIWKEPGPGHKKPPSAVRTKKSLASNNNFAVIPPIKGDGSFANIGSNQGKRRLSYPPDPTVSQEKNRRLDLEGIVLKTEITRTLKNVTPQTLFELKADLEQADQQKSGVLPKKIILNFAKKKHQIPICNSKMDILLDRFSIPSNPNAVKYSEFNNFLMESKAAKGLRGTIAPNLTNPFPGDRADSRLILELENAMKGQYLDNTELLRELHELDRDRNNFLSRESIEKALDKCNISIPEQILQQLLARSDTRNVGLHSIPKFHKYFERIHPNTIDVSKSLQKSLSSLSTPQHLEPLTIEVEEEPFSENDCMFDEGFPLLAEAIRKNDIDVIGFMPRQDVEYYTSMYNIVYNMGITPELMEEIFAQSTDKNIEDGEVDVERYLSILEQRRRTEINNNG